MRRQRVLPSFRCDERTLRTVATFVVAAAASACVPKQGPQSATAGDAIMAGAAAGHELTRPAPDDVLLGWGLEVIGDVAKVHPCKAEDSCGTSVIELEAKSILSVKTVGRVRPTSGDGRMLEEVPVVQLTVQRPVRTTRGGVATDPVRGLIVSPAK